MLDTNGRWAVLFTKAFIGVFFFFALVAGVAFAVQGDWVGIPISLGLMAGAGLLWISFFPSGTSIHPGQHIGGGLRLARVALEPGEVVVYSCLAGYAFGERGVAKLRRLMNNLVGETFLTDRRLIFSPYRISMRFRPTWVALTDIASIGEPGKRMLYGHGLRVVFEVKTRDGSTAVFWLRDQELVKRLKEAARSGETLPASSSSLVSPEEPGLFAFIWGWGATAGFIIMVLATQGTAGFRILPLGLMAVAMVSLVMWNTVRTAVRVLKPRQRRDSRGTL